MGNSIEEAHNFVSDAIKLGIEPCNQLIEDIKGVRCDAKQIEIMSEMMGITSSRDSLLFELSSSKELCDAYLNWWAANTNQLMLLDVYQKVNALTILSCTLFLQENIDQGIEAINHAKQLMDSNLSYDTNSLTTLLWGSVDIMVSKLNKGMIPFTIRAAVESAANASNTNKQKGTVV